MNIINKLCIAGFASALSVSAFSAPSINDMQSCQALLDFVDVKLKDSSASYPTADIKAIRNGLEQYNAFIQDTIITPGLLQYNAGDATKANDMQKQVDAYKLTLVNALNARYPDKRVYTDHAVAINNCAMKAVPSGEALEDLKVALTTLLKLAQSNP